MSNKEINNGKETGKIDNVKLTNIIKEFKQAGNNRGYKEEKLWCEADADYRKLIMGFAKNNNYVLLENKEEMEDFIQNVLMKALENLDDFRPETANFGTWLCGIAKNHYYNMLRKNMRESRYGKTTSLFHKNEKGEEVCASDKVLTCESAEDTVMKMKEKAEILKVVKKLHPVKMQVIMLLFYEEKSIAEAAEILGCTKKHVSKLRYKALEQLRKSFGVNVADKKSRKKDREDDVSEIF